MDGKQYFWLEHATVCDNTTRVVNG